MKGPMKLCMNIASKIILLIIVVSMLFLAGCQNQSKTDVSASPTSYQPQDTSAPPVNIVVFQKVHLISMTDDQVLANQTVVVADGMITDIGEAETVKIPAEAHIINGEGKYLMPGLVLTASV